MSIRSQFLLFTLLLVLFISYLAPGQEMAEQSAGRTAMQMKFGGTLGLPTCAKGAVQSGDPTKGASIIFAKMPAGCSIPWHWHTPSEHVMVVSGIGQYGK